jgi:glutathione S-transferase
MIKLYQLMGYWSIPSPSPFCMKLETYMRMANIPFQAINILQPLVAPANRMAPKKKIPFIDLDGELIGDTNIILDLLKKKYGDTIDQHLTHHERAIALSIQRLFEDHYFWTIVYSRWFDAAGWAVTRPEFFGGLSFLLRGIVPEIRKRKMAKVLQHNGIGRHSQKEVYDFGKKDLDAFATLLGDKPFIFGDRPTSADAMAHGFLVNTLHVPFDYELKQYAQKIETFEPYCQRINELYYKDSVC